MSPSSVPPFPAAVSRAPWLADQGDGTYRNPILFQDFSDPDGVRVGDTYFLVCSTFSHEPGLMLLQSRDLINWELVGHALKKLQPSDFFSRPRRGCGVWAPSLRHHAGLFWIFYPDPDFGLYMIQAKDFAGPWSEPVLVKPGRGLIDPCPLWDARGGAYLIHGWARSRSGINNVLTLHRMDPSGTHLLDEGKIVIDGSQYAGYHTLEGPKLYARNGWFYVFAPAGGVATGWQSVFRSRNIWGPYEERIVLAQGSTSINGPHQGAWLTTEDGKDVFFHFQDRGAFGRILHLQPMRWNADDWPVIGAAAAGAICGEPVLQHPKPYVSRKNSIPTTLPASDEFAGTRLQPQWQWEGSVRENAYTLAPDSGGLQLFVGHAPDLWSAANVLTQRVLGPRSVMTTELQLETLTAGARAGLVVMGRDYAWIALRRTSDGIRIVRGVCHHADKGDALEVEGIGPACPGESAQFRVEIAENTPWIFSYSLDGGENWTVLGEPFNARPGIWVGARVGLFAVAAETAPSGHALVNWWRVTA